MRASIIHIHIPSPSTLASCHTTTSVTLCLSPPYLSLTLKVDREMIFANSLQNNYLVPKVLKLKVAGGIIFENNLTLNARLTDQSAILIPCAEATDEQVRKEIHRNCWPPPSWVTSINQEVIHRIRLSNLRIGDISISPILICFSLSD